MTLLTGTRLGTYEIVGSLGAGGMGEVYRARDSRLKREVAIKVVSDRLTRDAELASRLRSEALILASVNHPNIAAIYGLEVYAGEQFFVMELVEGQTLAEIIASRVRLPWEEALTLCGQVAAALEAAHLKKVTHRDVKPSNVKVTPEGLVKVLDFGLAKTLRDTPTEEDSTRSTEILQSRTRPGTIVGTPAYMSPEQARGKLVDHRTDIWALGCLLYEMLTGKKAFLGETPSDTLAAILEREPDWHALPPGTPVRIKDLLRSCLQKDANLRFQGMSEVLAGIGKARAGGLRITRRQAIAAATASLVVVLAVVLRHDLERQWHILMLPKQKNIAVVRFRSIGGDSAQEAFADGLTATLTTALSRHGDLSVVPASDSRSLENTEQARRRFGVNLTVSGDLERRGDKVKLTLNLTDAERNRLIGTEPIDWPVAKLFEIEDVVLIKLADLLNLVLTEVPEGLASRVPGAYDAYLRGRGYLYRYDRKDNLDRALQSFEDAAFRDSSFALAYLGKAETYWRMFRHRKAEDPELLMSARLAAERALELNSGLATAHVVLGGIESDLGNYENAIRELQAAQKMDPLDPAPSREWGRLYSRLNRTKEADALYAKALSERPGDWWTWLAVGTYYANTQRFPEAEKYLRKLTDDLMPDNPEGWSNLGGVFLKQAGRETEAEEALQRSRKLNPTSKALGNLSYLYQKQHRYKEAVVVTEEAAALAARDTPGDYKVYGNLGDAYLLNGEKDKARKAWQRAAEIVLAQMTGKAVPDELWAFLAKYQAKVGDTEPALAHIEQALKAEPEGTTATVHYQAGLVYALLGRKDAALQHLAEAIKGNYSVDEIRQAPELQTLREDPGYLQLFASPRAKPK